MTSDRTSELSRFDQVKATEERRANQPGLVVFGLRMVRLSPSRRTHLGSFGPSLLIGNFRSGTGRLEIDSRATILDMLIRPAVPKDALAVARVHVRSWQVAYRGLLPDDYLDQLRPEDRAPTYDFATADPQKPRTIVATEKEVILGFATTAPSRQSDLPNHGELYALYVDPDHWGRGIGAALVSAARTHLLAAGFRSAFLWVLAGNVRAERFYRIDQWVADGTRRTDSVWGIQVDEVRYQRTL